MPKIEQWRDIFRYTGKAKKRQVQVGEKYEEMTGTQAYRFEELTQSRRPNPQPDTDIAPRKKRQDK